jgi:hypothetical protein
MNVHYSTAIREYIDVLYCQFNFSFDDFPAIVALNDCAPVLFVETFVLRYAHLFTHIRFYHPHMNEAFWWSFCDTSTAFIDWDCLSSDTHLSNAFWHHQCSKHTSSINWIYLVGNESLGDSFWLKEVSVHEDKIEWAHLCTAEHLSASFWDEVIARFPLNVHWNSLSQAPLDEWFIEKHLVNIQWRELCWNPCLSTAFWEKHCAERPQCIDWVELSSWHMQPLYARFWERYLTHPSVLSDRVCSSSKLDEAFWERHIELVDWHSLIYNKQLSASFWRRHIDQVNLFELCVVEHLPIEFWYEQCRVRPEQLDWEQLSVNPSLDETFWKEQIRDNPSFVQWKWLSTAPLSLQFWKPFLDRICWQEYIYNNSLSAKEWVEYAEFIDINHVAWNRSAPVEFWEKKDLSFFRGVFRRTFIRHRCLPLSFWRNCPYIDVHTECDLYRNKYYVSQLVNEQIDRSLSSSHI